MSVDIDRVRRHFPGLQSGWAFFDNAGGSQVLGSVVERIQDYMVHSFVQTGASYGVSQSARERLQEAARGAALLMNAESEDEVVMGVSTTQLLMNLANSLGNRMEPGDEIVVTNCDHESNIGPWMRLQDRGVRVKFWNIEDSYRLNLDDLRELLTERTKLVTLTHVSNILGGIHPVEEIARLVHEHGAEICVDGVALAPHRAIDVRAWDIDYYVFSYYKVFGPHVAVLYGKKECLEKRASNINHFFVGEQEVPRKLQPGGTVYELVYGTTAIAEYLQSWDDGEGRSPREGIVKAFDWIAAHEEALAERLLAFLRSKSRVRIIGDESADKDVRVATISFVVEGRLSSSIPPELDPHRVGIRYGHFYAKRLIDDLGLAEKDGVVRLSIAHYNKEAEVDRLIALLDPILD